MSIDFQTLGKNISRAKLWGKPLSDFTEQEILKLAECFFSAPDCNSGQKYAKPYIQQDGSLFIPANSHPKYHWWAGGQPAIETLKEIGAPQELIEKYSRGEFKAEINVTIGG